MHQALKYLLDLIPPFNNLSGIVQDVIVMVVLLIIFVIFVSVSALVLIWLERKISARMQNRVGPMVAAPWGWRSRNMWTGGLLQTGADAIKLLFKEDIIPSQVDLPVYKSASYLVITATMLSLIVIPIGQDLVVSNMNVGLLYLLAVSSLTVISIMMAGWGSNNKYSLLGGLRSVAQMISYEVPMIVALMGPVIMAGSLNLQDIVNSESTFLRLTFGSHHFMVGWPAWLVVNFLGFVVYLICGNAETNRPPFDLVEGESELVAGFSTEYSGMRFAMFYLAEFINMFIISCVATLVFLGGWKIGFNIDPLLIQHLPLVVVDLIGFVVFMTKAYLMVLLFMWVRWSFPRLRADHLMSFGWKVLLPTALVNLVIATFVTTIWVIFASGALG
ncbi:MAG TPA: NADH-quinone oxidoreductase subunit NuoH [Candidatus Xenobia bacterium]